MAGNFRAAPGPIARSAGLFAGIDFGLCRRVADAVWEGGSDPSNARASGGLDRGFDRDVAFLRPLARLEGRLVFWATVSLRDHADGVSVVRVCLRGAATTMATGRRGRIGGSFRGGAFPRRVRP